MLVTIDFETFFDKDFSLSKMPMQQYILSDRFEITAAGIKVGDSKVYTIYGTHAHIVEKVRDTFESLADLEPVEVVAHNASFDVAILKWVCGVDKVSYVYDTMFMANALLLPLIGSSSLATVASHLGVTQKLSGALENVKGMRSAEIAERIERGELKGFLEYLRHDVQACFEIYKILRPQIHKDQLDLMYDTVRMFVDRRIVLDKALLQDELKRIRQDKKEVIHAAHAALAALGKHVDVEDVPRIIRGEALPELIESAGVSVERKTTDAGTTWALAKSDMWIQRAIHDKSIDKNIRTLLEARLVLRSTIDESRITNFLAACENTQLLGIPLIFSSAHTHRFGGGGKINPQNLPRGSALRAALRAPRGCMLVVADLSQIEARVTAYLADEQQLLSVWERDGDVYCDFASSIFNRKITKADKLERFLGKVAILGLGYGMGATRFTDQLRQNPDVEDPEQMAEVLLTAYRNKYRRIKQLWCVLERMMRMHVFSRKKESYDPRGITIIQKNGVELPTGLRLEYPNIRIENDQLVYDKRDRTGVKERPVWGGFLTENLVQSLADAIIKDVWMRVRKQTGLSPALQVHDELVYVVPERYAESVLNLVVNEMSVPPEWCKQLPMRGEGAVVETYVEAK